MKMGIATSHFFSLLTFSLMGTVMGVTSAGASTKSTTIVDASSLLPGTVYYDEAEFFKIVRDSVSLDEEDILPPDSSVQIVFPADAFAVGFDLAGFDLEEFNIEGSGDAADSKVSITFLDETGNMIGFQQATLSAATPWFFGSIYTQPFRSIIVQSDNSELLTNLRYSVKPCMQY